ncbi:MATH domain-containing protein-like isoform X1 [Iris pallida]|uniref:MATH domain-containing protein-like isoform X1 n=1 Tax=Iris pallida TaxID=29817 RepID=A0AAX6IHL8_IRIPA|nr:MATH domain-containing protein-like isoform X1 [Iris pallida]
MGDCETRRLYTEGMSNVQRCQSEDSITESRSCGQVENGTPSTSPPYWDTDDDDDDFGPKPSALYGKFTWKIEKFSQINKRELRSNAFEVGGYKWYILIYPQGCDVCNHLSLFLCVANHDKLLPGWSHFAQFTISVVNKDPKKSKYSDTLHRFWKKEHDWGWKKFMELTKVADGFVNEDSLVIKAQVQVIREKAHRPFRCLDCQYRRELVRVYLANVEQICRRFIEERKGKLNKLIEDKMRWSSFRAFWLGIDKITRRRMSRDKTDAILKVVVKNFFIEKEVTSTLVMDSLYSGLKALEFQSKKQKGKVKLVEMEQLPAPMVCIEKDMFVLADDVLLLLERAAVEPMPHQPLPPKDDKGSQNRTKDGSSGEEFNKDYIERDERRLTELGRRTVEILVLVHIFSSRIEVAYQEAVALKRQEELIREEEAAEQAEYVLKAKRTAAEKEKRLKKKQAKQRRNSRKGKDRTKDEKIMLDKHQLESLSDGIILEDFSLKHGRLVIGKIDAMENTSDMSDTVDDVAETPHADVEDRGCSPINWDMDTSEIRPAMEAGAIDFLNEQIEKRTISILDDSSSTCSTESTPSLMNGSYKGNSLLNGKGQTSPNRGKSQGTKDMQSTIDARHLHGATGSSRATARQPEAILLVEERAQCLELHHDEKEEELGSLKKKHIVEDTVDMERPSTLIAAVSHSPSSSAGKKPSSNSLHQPKQSSENATTTAAATKESTNNTRTTKAEPMPLKEQPSNCVAEAVKSVPPPARSPQIPSTSRSEAQKPTLPPKSTAAQQTSSVSRPYSAPLIPAPRPYSAPLIPAPRPTVPVVSTAQTTPQLSRSVSAAGRLGTEPSPFAPSYVPQSYLNAIMGKAAMGASSPGLSHLYGTSSSQSFLSAASMLPSQLKPDHYSTKITFGSVKPEAMQIQRWQDDCTRAESSSDAGVHNSNFAGGLERLNIHGDLQVKRQYSDGVPSHIILPPQQGSATDEFPHLDIINDLLDEDKSMPRAAAAISHYNHPHHYHHPNFNRQYSLPASNSDIGSFNSTGMFDEGLFQRVYGSSTGSAIQQSRNGHYYPQVDLSAYASSQTEGTAQNQWPCDLSAADPRMLNSGGYPHELPDYSYSNGANGYVYRRPGPGL